MKLQCLSGLAMRKPRNPKPPMLTLTVGIGHQQYWGAGGWLHGLREREREKEREREREESALGFRDGQFLSMGPDGLA